MRRKVIYLNLICLDCFNNEYLLFLMARGLVDHFISYALNNITEIGEFLSFFLVYLAPALDCRILPQKY